MKHILSLLLSFLSPLALGANQTLSTRLNVGVSNNYVPGVTTGLVPSTGLPANSTGASASSGTVGYCATSFISSSSSVTLTSNTFANIASINLNAGTYIISGVAGLSATATVTNCNVALSAFSGNTTTDQTQGNNQFSCYYAVSATDSFGSIPMWFVTPTTNTTYYLKALQVFSSGIQKAYGRITACQIY